MRSGRTRDMISDSLAASRISQGSNDPAVQASPGSPRPIPVTEQPASTQWFARYPPIKPAAPVIKTFMVESRLQPRAYQFRHLQEVPVPGDNVPESRYLCSDPSR